jgi:hypothetical protein
MSFQDDLDFDPSDDTEDEALEVIEGYGIHVKLHCARIDCDNVDVMAVGEEHILGDHRTLHFQMPEGWGYDRHDGINPALHCPEHRKAPTPAEVKAINERLSGTALETDKSGDFTTEPGHRSPGDTRLCGPDGPGS